MKKSALVIIFNQDFSKNILKIEKLYSDRFSFLIYLVPSHSNKLDRLYRSATFPQSVAKALDVLWNSSRRMLGKKNPFSLNPENNAGVKSRIYSVTGHQYYFYDFVTQAVRDLLTIDVHWYWLVGDDVLLHPNFDETSVNEFLDLDKDNDCVLCRPVIGSDKWVRRITGSVKDAERKLKKAFANEFSIHNRLAILPESGAVKNKNVAVACSDFFGVRKDRLKLLSVSWKRCFREKLFVEIAIPFSVLTCCESPKLVDDFLWNGKIRPYEWEQMAMKLSNSEKTVFAHPVKLSAVPDKAITWMRSGKKSY